MAVIIKDAEVPKGCYSSYISPEGDTKYQLCRFAYTVNTPWGCSTPHYCGAQYQRKIDSLPDEGDIRRREDFKYTDRRPWWCPIKRYRR